MVVLLDTRTLLWALDASPRLSATARDLIEDDGNTILVSVVSAWEIEVKKALGRLDAPEDLEGALESAGFLKRGVTFADVRRLGTLPAHHRDPFDRMLVAQALVEGAPLVTGDPLLSRYPIQVIW
ncbi:MAG TPA: type II toxin-antitoxin system VapC family toxin [Kofleriaceae bacterium]|nr:type II toxin-antitoxin system VapC family toxin [Kofleriaceae bacterium]